MYAAIVNAAPSAPAATSTQQSAPAEAGAVSFAEVLSGMQGQGATVGTEAQVGAGKMTWRDMQTFGQYLTQFQNLGMLNASDMEGASLEDIVSNILTMLMGEETVGVSQEEGGQADELVLTLIGQLQDELQNAQAENGQIVIGQQLMVLLAQISGQQPTPTLSEDGTMTLNLQNGQEGIQTLLEAEPEDILQMLKGDAGKQLFTVPAQQTTQPQQMAQGQNPATQQAPLQQAGQTAAPQVQLPTAEVQQAPEGAQATQAQAQPPQQAQDPQMAFQNAVQTAKEKLDGTPRQTDETAPKLDLESVQTTNIQQVARDSLVTTGNADRALASQPFATQMEDGIRSGLQAGKSEFSIKLMPEGLGEVTVKLTETSEGMKLTLVAKSAETQRMLAAEIEGLRDSLRPMKIEVQEILTSRQEQLLNGQQNFQRQGRQDFEEMHGAAYYGDEPLGGEDAEEIQPILEPAQSALDTYI